MEVKASAKQLRVSANKVRRVLALIRGKNASEALMILKYTPNKPARYAEKVLKSAVPNAEHNYGLDMDKLIEKSASADQGTYTKRFCPDTMARARAFNHQTAHIPVAVCDK